MNPEEKRAYDRTYHTNRSPEDKIRKNQLQYQRIQRVVAQVRAYKVERGCKHCDENHPAVLDFHHIKKDKEYSIAEMARRGRSFKRLMEEIDKCEVLCSNCHRKHHWNLLHSDE